MLKSETSWQRTPRKKQRQKTAELCVLGVNSTRQQGGTKITKRFWRLLVVICLTEWAPRPEIVKRRWLEREGRKDKRITSS